jgi:hypothetical protein
VENACEFGIEPSGSSKCWETLEWLIYWCLSSGAQLRKLVKEYEMDEECNTHGKEAELYRVF